MLGYVTGHFRYSFRFSVFSAPFTNKPLSQDQGLKTARWWWCHGGKQRNYLWRKEIPCRQAHVKPMKANWIFLWHRTKTVPPRTPKHLKQPQQHWYSVARPQFSCTSVVESQSSWGPWWCSPQCLCSPHILQEHPQSYVSSGHSEQRLEIWSGKRSVPLDHRSVYRNNKPPESSVSNPFSSMLGDLPSKQYSGASGTKFDNDSVTSVDSSTQAKSVAVSGPVEDRSQTWGLWSLSYLTPFFE